jgi:hypothetical protein
LSDNVIPLKDTPYNVYINPYNRINGKEIVLDDLKDNMLKIIKVPTTGNRLVINLATLKESHKYPINLNPLIISEIKKDHSIFSDILKRFHYHTVDEVSLPGTTPDKLRLTHNRLSHLYNLKSIDNTVRRLTTVLQRAHTFTLDPSKYSSMYYKLFEHLRKNNLTSSYTSIIVNSTSFNEGYSHGIMKTPDENYFLNLTDVQYDSLTSAKPPKKKTKDSETIKEIKNPKNKYVG